MAQNLRQLARRLGRDKNDVSFRLGDTLLEIARSSDFHKWGHENWTDYIENEVCISVSQSHRLLRVARFTRGTGKPFIKQLKKLGITKTYHLSVLSEEQDIEAWLDFAEDTNINDLISALQDEPAFMVKRNMSIQLFKAEEGTVRKAIKLFPGNTRYGDALEQICDFYFKHHGPRKKQKA